MRAGYVVALALALLVIGRWAHNKPAFDIQTIAGGAFVIIVVSLLDQGATEDIAKGIAWILLAVVILNPDSPVVAIARAINTKATGQLTPGQKAQRGGPPQ